MTDKNRMTVQILSDGIRGQNCPVLSQTTASCYMRKNSTLHYKFMFN